MSIEELVSNEDFQEFQNKNARVSVVSKSIIVTPKLGELI
jgi:hypothetical protein